MLGLGTAALGRPQYINIRKKGSTPLDIEAFRTHGLNVLEDAYQLGIRYFDTAPGYGHAEQLLIDWLQTKNDPSIQVATKWGYTYVANFDLDAKVHETKEHSLKKLNEQWQVSKALLPHLAVYQIHSATLDTGVLKNAAVLTRLSKLKEEHNLKMGISSTGANQVEVIEKALNVFVDGRPLFDAFQFTFNVLDQSVRSLLSTLEQQNKLLIVKEALANGRLFRNAIYPHYQALYGDLEKLAKLHKVGVDAVALQFCIQSIPGSLVLSGASTTSQLKENLEHRTFVLTESDMAHLAQYASNPSTYWEERGQLQWN